MLLQKADLSQYMRKLLEAGYDSYSQIIVMEGEDLEEMGEIIGMLPGHLQRLRRTIESQNADAAPAATSAVEKNPVPKKRKSNFKFKESYTDWSSARLDSLSNSVWEGNCCMQDVKKSGGRCKIFRCTTVLSKKQNKDDDEGARVQQVDLGPVCPHVLIWRRKKSGKWHLDKGKSHLGHKPFCCSDQRVSKFELVNDPSFVKHVQLAKNITGKNAAQESLGQFGRMAGSVKDYTARRAFNHVKHYCENHYDDDWCKLAGWAREYERKNIHSKVSIDPKDGRSLCPCAHTVPMCPHSAHVPMQCPCAHNRFQRMFVSIAANIEVTYGCGMRFCAVDAAHSKHTIYRQGLLHLLTTRDGDNRVLVLCWAHCETESSDTYKYFSEKVWEAGLGRYLGKGTTIFSDRQKGLVAFFTKFKDAHEGKCFNHLIGNARDHIKGSGTSFEDATAWTLQKARTAQEYQERLAVLATECPMAANYFDKLTGDHVHTMQYAMNEAQVSTHGHKTSNIVECANGVFVDARKDAPYRMNNLILGWSGEKLKQRFDRMTKWQKAGHILTPYCHQLWVIQVSIVPIITTCAHVPMCPLSLRVPMCPCAHYHYVCPCAHVPRWRSRNGQVVK